MQMYKIFVKVIIMVSVSCLSNRTWGQEGKSTAYFSGDRKFYGGIVAGMNVSTVEHDNFGGYHLPGLNAGAIVYWHFIPALNISVELLYAQKGAKGVNTSYSPYAGSFYEKYTMRLNYVEVPLILNYMVSPRLQIGGGGSYSALMSSKETYETIYPAYINSDLSPFEKYEVDLIASGSLLLYKGLMLNVRYQYSVTPVRKSFYVPQGLGAGDQRNSLFSFRLAYLF